jgi:hypothetical protein
VAEAAMESCPTRRGCGALKSGSRMERADSRVGDGIVACDLLADWSSGGLWGRMLSGGDGGEEEWRVGCGCGG